MTSDLLDLARAHYRAGDIDETLRLAARVIDVSRHVGDTAAIAAAATLVRCPTDPLTRALAHTLAAQAMAELALHPELQASARAQWEATRNPFHSDPEPYVSDRPEETFLALQARVSAARDPLRSSEVEIAANAAISLGIGTNQPDYEGWGRAWLMDVHAHAGRRAALLHELAALTPLARREGMPWSAHALMVRASQAGLEGRFDDALALAAEARELGGDATYLDLVFRSSIARLSGHNAQAVLAEVRGVVEKLPFTARGWLCAALEATGQREEAEAIWHQLRAHIALPPDAPEFLIGLVSFAGTCVWLGDSGAASILYGQLRPYAGFHAIGLAQTPYEGPVDLALGRLARLMGKRDEARAHFEEAVASCRALGARAFEALTLAELAGLSHPRSRSRHEHAIKAAELAERLGMKRLAQRANQLLRPTVGRRSPLTSREQEVAALVARGLSNAAIAANLHLSERTIESHVSRIMLKLGVDSRVAVAAWQTRQLDT